MTISSGVAEVPSPKVGIAHRASDRVGHVIAARPLQAMCGCCFFIILIPALMAVTVGFGMTTEDGAKDWHVLSASEVQNEDAIKLAEDMSDCIPLADGNCPTLREREFIDYSSLGLTLMYETIDQSEVLTAKNLQVMCKLERTFTGSSNYLEACQLINGRGEMVRETGRDFAETDCAKQTLSIVHKIYLEVGSESDLFSCSLLDSAAVAAASTSLHEGLQDSTSFAMSGFFIGSDVVSGTSYKGGRTYRTRSLLGLGYPLKGRDDDSTDDIALEKTMSVYKEMFFDQFAEDFYEYFGYASSTSPMSEKFEIDNLNIVFGSAILANEEINKLASADLNYAIGSIIFTFLYLTFHSGSVFLAALSVWQVVMSLFLAMFFYRIVLGITYFRELHLLLVFVILGIGADNIFIFSDAWREYEATSKRHDDGEGEGEDKQKVLAERVAFAWHHSMTSVMNTMLTTVIAFCATGVSPIMPIGTLGYYGALLVLMNYILLITFTPCVFAVHATYPKFTTCPDFGCCRCITRRTAETTPTDAENPAYGQDPASTAATTDDDAHTPWILRKYVLPTLSKRPVALAGVLLLVAWGVTNIYFALQLDTPTETLKVFDDDHMVTIAQNLNDDGFAASPGSEYATVKLSFGIAGVDRDVEPYVNAWKPSDWYGIPVFDSSFDLTTRMSQEFLINVCDDLIALSCSEPACTPYNKVVMPGDRTMSCFMKEFESWTGGVVYEGDAFLEKLNQFRTEETPSATEVGDADWKNSIGFVDGKLKYVTIEAQITLKSGQADRVKEPVKDILDNFVTQQIAKAPTGMKSIIQTVPSEWTMLVSTQAVLSGMFLGFAICFPAVFLVLLLATGNIIVATVAVIAIIFVVGNVLGYCWLAGWSLGITESIAAIIVIGLSVDYVIHLGHMYLEGGVRDGLSKREQRWRFAMRLMGGTVVAGAITTLGAGVVMQACTLQFFRQMSTLIIMTIVYSILYAMIGFMGFLRLAGPEGDQGDIAKMFMTCFRALKPSSKVDANMSHE